MIEMTKDLKDTKDFMDAVLAVRNQMNMDDSRRLRIATDKILTLMIDDIESLVAKLLPEPPVSEEPPKDIDQSGKTDRPETVGISITVSHYLPHQE